MPKKFGGNHQGEKSVPIPVLVKPGLKILLEAAATDQFRSASSQVTKYIVDGLRNDGYIVPSMKEAE